MGAIGLVATRELRRRWARVGALILAIGIAGACTIAAAAGARRSSTALERFRQSSRSADIELQVASTSGAELASLRRTRHVAAVGVLDAYGILLPDALDFQGIVVPADAQFGTVVDRDRVVAGRAANARSADEATIGEGLAARLHVHVGDRLRATTLTPPQVGAVLGGAADAGPPQGPVVELQIVGIVRRPLDLGEQRAAGGLLVLTPAFRDVYGERVGAFGARLRVRTDDGARDAPAVIDAANHIFGSKLFSAQSLAIQSQGASDAIDVLTFALWIVALLAGVVSACAIGVLLSRETTVLVSDYAVLRELGCTRWQRAAVAGAATVLIAIGGAVLAGLGAIAMSPIFPLGVARRADPAVGVRADWTLLALGVAVVVVFTIAVALMSAYRATRFTLNTSPVTRVGRQTIAEQFAARGARPSVSNGVRMALERGRGRGAAPVRSAVTGAVVGLVGIAGVVVFASNVNELVATPKLYGTNWDFTIADTTNNTACGASDYGVSRVANVTAVAEVCAQNVNVGGRPVAALAFTQLSGDRLTPGITAGRAPIGSDEVALGSKTMQALRLDVGDAVTIAGRHASHRYTIVGRAVFPTAVLSQPLADGAAFTGEGYAPLFDQNIFQRAFVGRYAAGSDRPATARQLDAIPQLGSPTTPVVPVEVDRLNQIDWLPVLLVALFGALAILAVAHALAASVRRRRRELALLKALGFSRRQLRTTVATNATTVAVVGIVLGLPAGIGLGALAWRRVATGLGVQSATTIPVLALLAVAIVALGVANAIAWAPGRAAARTHPAAVLTSD